MGKGRPDTFLAEGTAWSQALGTGHPGKLKTTGWLFTLLLKAMETTLSGPFLFGASSPDFHHEDVSQPLIFQPDAGPRGKGCIRAQSGKVSRGMGAALWDAELILCAGSSLMGTAAS